MMSSKINLVHKETTAEQSLKRNRYDSTSDNPKRRKSDHIDMDLSDGEDADEIIEIQPPLPVDDDDDDDIQEVIVNTFRICRSVVPNLCLWRHGVSLHTSWCLFAIY